jgi:hypothetical protein
MICTPHTILLDQIENEIGSACSTYGEEKRCRVLVGKETTWKAQMGDY